MSHLTVYLEQDARRPELATSDHALMEAHLALVGVLFEHWHGDHAVSLPADAGTDAVLDAYAVPVERLAQARRFQSVDVVRITPGTAGVAALRGRFLDEHTHDEDEARFFVEGSGAFYLHANRRVFRVVCEAGDLLSIPAGAPHWFDMGPRPHVTAIRFFTRPDGWVAHPTGDTISARFPLYEPQSQTLCGPGDPADAIAAE
ncbi:cupin domain-containing protein [Azospirillum sp. TSO35-2]|uniref:1,2-dihydroxy-3-keto-5-methylthiopentene dioxygenase n=1 Tax=Azospirillum sp. TSO35-2 TaxID=716796 RepID=UPI000D61D09C|nr:cupin domain-containing protein [Azospirillum sp. TSO35-2]PWC32419.1 acireductone dioxygenase [Azospirillum sp. TSO35-2]